MPRLSQRLYAEGHARIVPGSVENGVNGSNEPGTGGTEGCGILNGVFSAESLEEH